MMWKNHTYIYCIVFPSLFCFALYLASPPKKSPATLCECTQSLCSSICLHLTSVCPITWSALPALWWQWATDPSTTCSHAPFRWRSPASPWLNAWPTSSVASGEYHCCEESAVGLKLNPVNQLLMQQPDESQQWKRSLCMSSDISERTVQQNIKPKADVFVFGAGEECRY